MGELLSALIIAIVQGITEWIPVSSSGHIVLFDMILNYNGGLLFEVALHFGTLMAVFVYFGREISDIIEDMIRLRFGSENGKTGVKLIVASIPAGIAGYLGMEIFESVFSKLVIIALGFGITGLLLFIASMDTWKERREYGPGKALVIGIAQAISIIPGISRSGATISTAIMLGLNPKEAAKFSFLMAIPVILGANIMIIGNQRLPSELIWATIVSFIMGLLIMHFLFKVVLTSRKNLRWFAGYALLLSIGMGIYLSLG